MNIAAFHKPFSRRTPEQWQTIINDQQVSGLPQKAYCHKHGLSLATFCNWKKKLVSHHASNNTHTTDPVEEWVEVPAPGCETQSGHWDIELELPGGVTLRMQQA